MPKREDVLEALAWLAKWFGGRRERLRERIRQYEARVAERLIAEAISVPRWHARPVREFASRGSESRATVACPPNSE